MLEVSLNGVGGYTTKDSCKKEHHKGIYFTYARFVKINYLKAQLCAYSLIQVLCRPFRILQLQSMETYFGYKQQYLEEQQMNIQEIWDIKGCNTKSIKTTVFMSIWNAENISSSLFHQFLLKNFKPLQREVYLLGLDNMERAFQGGRGT